MVSGGPETPCFAGFFEDLWKIGEKKRTEPRRMIRESDEINLSFILSLKERPNKKRRGSLPAFLSSGTANFNCACPRRSFWTSRFPGVPVSRGLPSSIFHRLFPGPFFAPG